LFAREFFRMPFVITITSSYFNVRRNPTIRVGRALAE
jgi:hypothetical protein